MPGAGGRDLLEALERSDGLRAVVVEGGNAVRVVVLVEVREVAGEEHVALVLQLDEQRAVPRRMAGRTQDHDGAVAEHVLVQRQRLDLAARADPLLEAIDVRPRHLRVDAVPISLADEQRRVGERTELPGVVGVEVADADVLDLLRGDLELRELFRQADLRRVRAGSRRESGVPHHVVAAVLDHVAAEGERQHLVCRIGKGVGKALGDGDRLRAGAAVEAGERHFGGRLRPG
jgi:hypothetical protein